MRTLAIDFGQKRVGLALSDAAGKLALPYKTLENKGRKKLVQEILQIMDLESVGQVVLGLPAAQNEDEQHLLVRQIRNVARSLQRASASQVWLVDETLSSFEARERLSAAGVSSRDMQAVLDQQAATVILELFLQSPDSSKPCF